MTRTEQHIPKRSGYVLIAVLIVVVVLSLAAYQFTELMTAEYRASTRSTDAAQARLSAASGVHTAAAMLADPNTFYGELAGNPSAAWAFEPAMVRPGGPGGRESWFSLVAVVPDGYGGYEQRYGAVVDEAGKLNINAMIQLDSSGEQLYAALMKLPNMTAEVADAIVDWVDSDDDPRPTGAESSYYLSLPVGYQAKNGPLNSLDELLLVKGMTPQLLFGNDRNRNGLPDDDPNGSAQFSRGLAEYLTVYGRELNVDSTGVLRENVNESEDLPALHERLTAVAGQEIADFILAYKMFRVSRVPTAATVRFIELTAVPPAPGATVVRVAGSQDAVVESVAFRTDSMLVVQDRSSGGSSQQNTVVGSPADLSAAVQAALQDGSGRNRRRIRSLVDLVNARVTLPKPSDAPREAPTVVVDSPLANPSRVNEMLGLLMDKTTATANIELTPRVNVNTAPREVLLAIPNMTEADVDAIINQRDTLNPADPATISGAWLITVAGMSPDTFKRVEKYVTGRTMVYRIQALGYFAQGGPVARVEAVIDTNQGAPRFLYYRDLTDLDTPRGFEPPLP